MAAAGRRVTPTENEWTVDNLYNELMINRGRDFVLGVIVSRRVDDAKGNLYHEQLLVAAMHRYNQENPSQQLPQFFSHDPTAYLTTEAGILAGTHSRYDGSILPPKQAFATRAMLAVLNTANNDVCDVM